MTVTIDWENLGFSYMKLPYRYIARFKMDMGSRRAYRGCNLAYFRVFSKSSLWTTSL